MKKILFGFILLLLSLVDTTFASDSPLSFAPLSKKEFKVGETVDFTIINKKGVRMLTIGYSLGDGHLDWIKNNISVDVNTNEYSDSWKIPFDYKVSGNLRLSVIGYKEGPKNGEAHSETFSVTGPEPTLSFKPLSKDQVIAGEMLDFELSKSNIDILSVGYAFGESYLKILSPDVYVDVNSAGYAGTVTIPSYRTGDGMRLYAFGRRKDYGRVITVFSESFSIIKKPTITNPPVYVPDKKYILTSNKGKGPISLNVGEEIQFMSEIGSDASSKNLVILGDFGNLSCGDSYYTSTRVQKDCKAIRVSDGDWYVTLGVFPADNNAKRLSNMIDLSIPGKKVLPPTDPEMTEFTISQRASRKYNLKVGEKTLLTHLGVTDKGMNIDDFWYTSVDGVVWSSQSPYLKYNGHDYYRSVDSVDYAYAYDEFELIAPDKPGSYSVILRANFRGKTLQQIHKFEVECHETQINRNGRCFGSVDEIKNIYSGTKLLEQFKFTHNKGTGYVILTVGESIKLIAEDDDLYELNRVNPNKLRCGNRAKMHNGASYWNCVAVGAIEDLRVTYKLKSMESEPILMKIKNKEGDLLSTLRSKLSKSRATFSQKKNTNSNQEVIVTKDVFPDIRAGTLEQKAALHLEKEGVIGGFPDGEFKGSRNVNRAETAKLLLLAKKIEVTDSSVRTFYDVLNDQWYAKYIKRAHQLGIISGYADGSFRPSNTVNTVEFLKMMTKTFSLEEDLPYIYEDVFWEDWFTHYAGIARRYDLFPDRSSTRLEPGRMLTRKEVAIAIYQYLNNR